MSATSLPTKRLTVYTPELSVIVGGFRPVYLNTFTGESKEGDIIDIPLSTMLDYELKLDFNFDKVNLAIEGEWAAYMQAQLGSNNYYTKYNIGLYITDAIEVYNSSTYHFDKFFGNNKTAQSNTIANIYFSRNRPKISSGSIEIRIPSYSIFLTTNGFIGAGIPLATDYCLKHYADFAIPQISTDYYKGGVIRYPLVIYPKFDSIHTNEAGVNWCYLSHYFDQGQLPIKWTGLSTRTREQELRFYSSSAGSRQCTFVYSGEDYKIKKSPLEAAKVVVEVAPTYDIVLATDSITSKYIFSDSYCDKYIYNMGSSYKNPGYQNLFEHPEYFNLGLFPCGDTCVYPITTNAVNWSAPIQRFIHPSAIPDFISRSGYKLSTIDIGIVSVPTTTNYYFAITTALLTFDVNDTVYDPSTTYGSIIYCPNINTERMMVNGTERWVTHLTISYDGNPSNISPFGNYYGKIFLHLDGEYRMSTYST